VTALRAVYLDLDGTLLGRDGSLLHDGEGTFSLLGARALEACERAGAEVCLYSGRTRAGLVRDARMLGVRACAFEAGAGLWVDGEVTWLTGAYAPKEATSVHDQITASGAPAALLKRYAGRLEYHDPWHTGREVSHLLRGRVDLAEANALVARHGLRLLDNGASHRRSPVPDPRVYHLVPAEVSKAGGVAAHMRLRGYEAQDVIAVGDSLEDLETATVVGTFWFVANAPAAPTAHLNVRRAEDSYGAGVYEAVITTLAERRA